MNEPTDAYRRVALAFDHQEPDRVPLWGIIENRPLYEHVLGPGHVGPAAQVSLDDKCRLHAQVYRSLGIDITRAHLWPPDPGPQERVNWRQHTLRADQIEHFQPALPDEAARDEEVAVRRQIVRTDRPHTVFAPSLRGCLCPVFEQMGLEEFSYACADSPAQVERLMHVYAGYYRSLAQRYAACAEARYVAVCDDLAFKGGLMFPPAWMRRVWLPIFRQIIEPLKAAGIKVIFHSDGNMEALIEDLIGIGVDAINPLEPLAGMDLAALKRRYGRAVTLIGGVDCSQLLPFGTPGAIRDEVRRLLDIGAPGGGFIIGDSSQILPMTPVENVLAFYQTVHEYRG